MAYKVHKFNVGRQIDDIELEKYLNDLRGEVISIIPNTKPTMNLMGATARCDYLVIIEKTQM